MGIRQTGARKLSAPSVMAGEPQGGNHQPSPTPNLRVDLPPSPSNKLQTYRGLVKAVGCSERQLGWALEGGGSLERGGRPSDSHQVIQERAKPRRAEGEDDALGTRR